MSANHVEEDDSAEKDGGFVHVEPDYGDTAEVAGDSVNQRDSINSEPNVTKPAEDGARDDMFVDCPDEIENSGSNQSSEEKTNLPNDQDDEADSGINVQALMSEIELLRNKLEKSDYENERLARENKEENIREYHSVLSSKDQEIEFLNAKIAELSESSNIAQSNFQLYELQLEKERHIEEITNRILASLFTVHNQEELLEGSLAEKISNAEKSVTFLVERHNLFISESDQLKRCLNDVGLDPNTIDENGAFSTACDKIIELRGKEDNLHQRLSSLEDENRNLVEQLEKQRLDAGNLNAEIGRLNAEVEQEKNRYSNTKEKLSMAVTKGKALVQQRDSLKQLVAEKTSHLEKCSVELQEKSIALEAAEKTKELVLEKDAILQTYREILSESMETNESQPMDIADKLRWVADENKSLKAISLQYHKLRDALMSFDFPETVASSELDDRARWLAESCYMSKEEAMKLQSELDKTKEAAHGEIDHLTTSLLAETQEKSYLQAEFDVLSNKYDANERLRWDLAEEKEAVNNEMDHLRTSLLAESQEKSNIQLELENLRHIYEGVVQKEYLVSQEKDKLVNMLMEASGLVSGDGHEEVLPEHSDSTTIIDNCFSKIKENVRHNESAQVDAEIFERFMSILYIRDQEMSLYKLIIEEDVLDSTQASRLSDELEMKIHDLNALKAENAIMQKSCRQIEDRCALLKDKLSMAVKKGKGLVQERENLKNSLDEKNSEIDRLMSEIQGNLSKYSESQDQIAKLSLDVERISLLEKDLFAEKEQKNQLEQFLAESNSMLQRVIESIEEISTPTDLVFKEPVEKVKWIAQALSETESLKMEMEQELRKVKGEAISLTGQLSEVQKSMQEMEDALSVAENSRSRLLDEKKDLEVSKTLLEEELEKEKEKAYSNTGDFEELLLSKKALEDALSLAEDNISRFVEERDIAIESSDLSEEQLQKLKEEFSNLITKLAEADKTIQSLQDELSLAQNNIILLSEENSNIKISTADFDNEMNKIREEAESHAGKLSEASLMINSLEGALLNAENNMADLVREKKSAEEEIAALTAKLDSHTEELAGTRGGLDDRVLEISGHLSSLHLLLEDETLPSSMGKCFDIKFERLNIMDSLMNEIADCFVEMELDFQQSSPVMEDDSSLSNTLPSNPDTTFNLEILNEKMNAVDNESLVFQIEKMSERFHLKSKMLADKFDSLSILMDESIAALSRRLHSTKDKVVSTINYAQSLKQKVTDKGTDKQRQEEILASMEIENRTLLSACNDVIQRLELNVRKNVAKLDGIISVDLEIFGDDKDKELADHVKTDEKLLLVTERNEYLNKLFQDAINKLMSITEDTQNRMKETQLICDEVLEERGLYKEKISSLETDLKTKLNLCDEMAVKLSTYEEKEDEWRKKDVERSSSLSELHDIQNRMRETQLTCDEVLEERGLYKEKISSLETDLKVKLNLCDEMAVKLAAYEEKEDEWRKKDVELSSSLSELHDIQNKMKENQLTCDEVLEERSLYKEKISSLETELKVQLNTCDEMAVKLAAYEEKEDEWRKKDVELSSSLSELHDIQNKMKENQLTCDEVLEERSLYKEKISSLETELEVQLNTCDEMAVKLAAYEEKEDEWRKKDVELSSSLSKLHDIQNRMKETQLASDEVLEERNLYKEKISSLETDLKAQLNLCDEMSAKLAAYEEKEDEWRKKDVELSSLSKLHEDTQNRMKETQLTCDEVLEEVSLYKGKISSLETDLKAQLNLCDEMEVKLATYEEKEDEWRKKDVELSSSLSKLHEFEDSLLSASQVRSIVDKVNELKIPDDSFPVGDSRDSASLRKVFYVVDSYNEFPKKVSLLSTEKEELQSTIDQQILEIELLKRQHDNRMAKDQDSEIMNTLLELESGLRNIVRNLGGSDAIDDHKLDDAPTSLLPLLDKLVMAKMHESKDLKSKTEELGVKLLGTQKVVDDLSSKVKFLEDSNHPRSVPSEVDLERRISIASLPSQSEITEIQDMAVLGNNNNVLPVQSAAHVRQLMRKSSSDQLAISIDSESEHLINNKKSDDDDKGHLFKSLNNSGLIPRQGRTVADRVDGIWVSGSRALMSHPRGRVGLIVYWLVLHIWLLGTIL